MSKGGDAPAPPDYTGAAREQAAASKEITNIQNFANRPQQYTPWGSSEWSTYGDTDPATGQAVTRWVQEQALNPQLQNALNQQLGIQQGRSDLAGGFMGRVAESYAQPFDWTNIPQTSGVPQAQLTGTYEQQSGVPQYTLDRSAPMQTTQTTNEPAFAQERQRIEQALFDRMRPEQQYQEDRTRTMLANQGLTPGSEAYNRELNRLQQAQAGERYNALMAGGQEQARMQQMLLAQQQQAFGQDAASQQAQNQALQQQFGQGLQAGTFYNTAGNQAFTQGLQSNQQNFTQMQQQADYQNKLRQQAIAEQQLQRGMSLNELNALLEGQQVQNPTMPQFVTAQQSQTPDLLGAMNAGYQSQVNAANAQQAGNQGFMSGLFGLGGAILGGPAGASIGSQVGNVLSGSGGWS